MEEWECTVCLECMACTAPLDTADTVIVPSDNNGYNVGYAGSGSDNGRNLSYQRRSSRSSNTNSIYNSSTYRSPGATTTHVTVAQ